VWTQAGLFIYLTEDSFRKYFAGINKVVGRFAVAAGSTGRNQQIMAAMLDCRAGQTQPRLIGETGFPSQQHTILDTPGIPPFQHRTGKGYAFGVIRGGRCDVFRSSENPIKGLLLQSSAQQQCHITRCGNSW